MVGTDRERIVSVASELLTSRAAYERMANAVNPVWRRAGERPDRRGARGALRMRLLVTGGTGFIGSHLAEEGRRRGAEVVVLGLTDRPEEQANAALLSGMGVEVLPGSITDAELCRRAARGATHIFHLAVAMREGGKSDEFFESINLDGTRHLLEAATAAAGRALRLLQHHRDLRPPGSRHYPGGIAARAGQHLRAHQGLGGAPGARLRRELRASVRDPPPGRRLRSSRSTPAQAVQGSEPGTVPAVRLGEGPPPHGVRGRRRIRVLPGLRARRRQWARG